MKSFRAERSEPDGSAEQSRLRHVQLDHSVRDVRRRAALRAPPELRPASDRRAALRPEWECRRRSGPRRVGTSRRRRLCGALPLAPLRAAPLALQRCRQSLAASAQAVVCGARALARRELCRGAIANFDLRAPEALAQRPVLLLLPLVVCSTILTSSNQLTFNRTLLLLFAPNSLAASRAQFLAYNILKLRF